MKTEIDFVEIEVENFSKERELAKQLQKICNTKGGGGWFPYSQTEVNYSGHTVYKVHIVRRVKDD